MIQITRRLVISVLAGMALGVVCVIGANIRFGGQMATYLVFALWFNRLVMGITIGAPWGEVSLSKSLTRGALLGLIVSFAYYSTTGFADIVSFLAGVIYGVIIEFLVFKMTNPRVKNQ
ncbi:MAG: hypothetical protein GX046_05295 [Tissierellia bacterium]|nr:hypothetical protein [Tissierellia bacterium]